jgi:6-phosphofructokinase 2
MLASEGSATQEIEVSGLTRENFTISQKRSDQQYRFVLPGPELTEGEWSQALNALFKADPKPEYLVASGSLPPGVPDDFYARLAKRCRETGARFIVDTSGPALRKALEAGVFMVKPNMREINYLSDDPVESEDNVVEVAQRYVKDQCCEMFVVSLGAGGAWLITNEYQERINSPTVPIRSKVGAGDSTVAGMVLALARGKSVIEAVAFGIAAGASAVQTPGTELCRKEDTEKLYEKVIEKKHE